MSVQCTASGDTLSRNDTSIGGTTLRSVSLWWRKTTSSDNAFFEINFGGGSWGVGFSTFGGDAFIGDFNNVGGSADYSFTFVVGTWYHTVYTYDGTNIRVYMNGALVSSPAWSSVGAPAGTNWNFGQSNVELQDICIYDAVLTAPEAAQLYVSRRPRRTLNLLAYYPFFAGANRTLDYSGNARTLTSAGTPSDGADSAPAGWGGGEPRTNTPGVSTINLVGSGGIAVAGSATIAVQKDEVGSGGVQSAGSATVTAQKDLVGSGGVATAGSATVSVQRELAGSGGVQSAGSANIAATKALAGSGGIQSAGFATLTGGGGGGGATPSRASTTPRRMAMLSGGRRRIR